MSARDTSVSSPTFEAECHGCEWTSNAANALGNAARHHDATGHAVTVDTMRTVTYGDPAAVPPGQGGRGAGIRGRRSGLWGQYARIIGEVEPEAVLIENVPALLHRGFEVVVRDLVDLGYRVEWDCLPAAAFGAPHLRDRVWVVAHRLPEPSIFGQPAALFALDVATATDLVGGDDDNDGEASPEWARWPRAGWVDGDPALVMPLEPLAPVAVARQGRAVLLPTPEASDGTGGRNESAAFSAVRAGSQTAYRPSGAKASLSLRTAVSMGREPTPAGELLPTPVANDVKGDVVAHLRNKNGWDRANRDRITSLAVLARNGFRQPSPEQLAEAKRTAAETDRAARTGWTDRDAAQGEAGLFPTPCALDGTATPAEAFAERDRLTAGPADVDVAKFPTPRATDGDARNRGDLIAHAKERPNSHHPGHRPAGRDDERRAGALNPTWVEWLMGFPLGWTDPRLTLEQLVPWPWSAGEPPGIPRISDDREHRRDRLTALGNALVPAAPAWLGARYLAARARHHRKAA